MTPDIAHPAVCTPSTVPELPPAVKEELSQNPEAFGALLRPFFADRYWEMLNDFPNLTTSQKLEFLKLGADVTGVKGTKAQEGGKAGAGFSVVINIPGQPSAGITVDATPIAVTQD